MGISVILTVLDNEDYYTEDNRMKNLSVKQPKTGPPGSQSTGHPKLLVLWLQMSCATFP